MIPNLHLGKLFSGCFFLSESSSGAALFMMFAALTDSNEHVTKL